MTWTYNGPTTPSGEVRLMIGDTDATRPLLSDDEILYSLAKASDNVDGAALIAAGFVLAKIATKPDSESVGDVTISWSSVRANMLTLIGQLKAGLAPVAYPGPNIDRDPAFTRETHFEDTATAFPEDTIDSGD